MRGNICKHNWNGFCSREKCINIHVVYDHTYFSILIMIPLLLMLMTTCSLVEQAFLKKNLNFNM